MTADEFISKWEKSGGNERANTQLFLTDLCTLLAVDSPQPTQSDVALNDYVFERNVIKTEIDGTLLERALNPKERAKLGAHYTPRAYVERLVQPTIMEPLKEDWLGARTAAAEAGGKAKARKIVEAFHGKLARTKVLDPACGTGNFLYVAMARMKELEGETLELLEELGDDQYLAEISGHTITPENFLGIEINPRAAAIAQLVLWIGYLQWHFRVNGEERMPEPPILRDVKTIENRDALIEWDDRVLERDERGLPVTRWDGETKKKHPVTGKDVPDETARVEVYRYVNPRSAKWPKADFIVGNPPFIGNKRMRRRLGDGYVVALRRAWRNVPANVDLVMYWWDQAARLARKSQIRTFGFVSTNSIKQISNRAVISRHRSALDPLSISYAIPDHPWRDPETDAAVRVSFTVARGGKWPGAVQQVFNEQSSRRNGDDLMFESIRGTVNGDLTIGSDTTQSPVLKSNARLAYMGVIPVGLGFRVAAAENVDVVDELEGTPYLRHYLGGSDLTDNIPPSLIVDVGALSEQKLSENYPATFQHIWNEVRPHRLGAERANHKEFWWRFGEQRVDMRKALGGLSRYLATTETAKHRVFSFLESQILPDQKLRVIALADAIALGVLNSRAHVVWAAAAGGRQGVGNDFVYNHSRCFDPFPFPTTDDEALKSRIREAAENLDALRKEVLERHADLTLTKLYNTLEALRAAEAAGGVLSDKERDIATRGCASLIRHYHDEIDAAVAEAYGWPADLSDERILERLVALNKERAAEEAKGQVRWLRKEFQASDYVAPAEERRLDLGEGAAKPEAQIIEWPGALPEQVVAVAGVVDAAGKPIGPGDVARAFKGKRASTVLPVLDALAGMGRLRKLDDGRYAA